MVVDHAKEADSSSSPVTLNHVQVLSMVSGLPGDSGDPVLRHVSQGGLDLDHVIAQTRHLHMVDKTVKEIHNKLNSATHR